MAKKQEPEYKIEDNVPIPEKRSGKSQLLMSMKVGQSIQFHADERMNFSTIAGMLKRRHKYEFNYTIKSVGNGNYRIWRTEADTKD